MTRILAAACHCFTEQGFAATRISDIARHAEIGKGTIYEYVRSKEDLLLDACLHLCQRNEQQMQDLAVDVPLLDATGEPAPGLTDGGHPVRAAFTVLRSVVLVALGQNEAELRMFSDLQFICLRRPDLLAKAQAQLGQKLERWLDGAFRLGCAGIAAGYFHPIDEEDYRWCARIIVAAVDGLVLQRCFLGSDEDLHHTADAIAKAWLRLHLKQPQRLTEYLQS